ncbi:MAG: HAD-IA family hydrolase [Deltaproteobacteria bacterium]|nr:HAD-IA family hydrolase [Candidatus Anaeroferrophillus wilburensis]MBN2889806.1 HAD-IA family hydrolase [Deltaproteobacteria bacterium]
MTATECVPKGQKLKAVIFDCDGVLFASEAANLAYYNCVFAVFGLPEVAADDHRRLTVLHTFSTPQVLEYFFGRGGLYEDAYRYAQTLDYRRFVPFMVPQAGLHEVLAELAGRFQLAIATNRTNTMELISDDFQLGSYFRHVVTATDVPRPKPYPDMLCHALDLLQICPEEAIYVGDSSLDWEASKGAGIPFVGFSFQPPQGGVMVSRLVELVELLADR